MPKEDHVAENRAAKKKVGIDRRIKLFNRFALRRTGSHDRITADAENDHNLAVTSHDSAPRRRGTAAIHVSASMPAIATTFSSSEVGTDIVAIDVPSHNEGSGDEASTIGSQNESDSAGIKF